MQREQSGIVIEERKNYYVVLTQSQNAPRKTVRCTLKGSLKIKRGLRVSSGDSVSILITDNDNNIGIISQVNERTNFLPRPPLANLSQVIFINTFKHPKLDLETIDRFLFIASCYDIKAVIVFNKTDLLNSDELFELQRVAKFYDDVGYKIIYTSAEKNRGVENLLEICENKTSAFAGLSGVGKSSLLSLIFPHVDFVTNEVSGSQGRGTHTTTYTKLLQLNDNTFIADTPGFAFVDLPTVDVDSVAAHFPEINKQTGLCKFNNCIHDAEPDCVVWEKARSGEIAPWRRMHYLKFYREMESRIKK